MSESKPDTVPGLGFKDKEKAMETLKILDGRDPDYQKLAIKGLIGRAKRTLTLTKDKEKLQNINDAMALFENWLRDFEINNLSKENRAYLPLNAIESLLPLKTKFDIADETIESFVKAYKDNAKGDYKNLRTVSSNKDSDGPTWDIVRNTTLKKLLKAYEEDRPDLWKDDLPTKEHMEMILWAYSPDASKIKKNTSAFEEKLGSTTKLDEEMDDDKSNSDEDDTGGKKKGTKRKSSSSEHQSDSNDDESPKKKGKVLDK